MYIPEHFSEPDQAEIMAIMAGSPLACVVAHTAGGLLAEHIPLLYDPAGVLTGHIARANSLWKQAAAGQEALAVFQGPNAYVSPNFYPSKAAHHRHVPTWNYQAVHVFGTISFQHDERSKRAVVGQLTRTHETRLNGKQAWRMADAPAEYLQGMLENIVAVRVEVTRVLAKSKLSQNREPGDYLGVIHGLEAAGQTALADQMRKRLDG